VELGRFGINSNRRGVDSQMSKCLKFCTEIQI